jgi:hypothetical protein
MISAMAALVIIFSVIVLLVLPALGKVHDSRDSTDWNGRLF